VVARPIFLENFREFGGLLHQGRNIELDSLQVGIVLLEDSSVGGVDFGIRAWDLSHTHYNNLDFSSFSSRNKILETSMGPSANPLFPYPPPNDHKMALAQAPLATHESGIKTLDYPFSKHRYPRYCMGMAPSSLALAIGNHRLGKTLAPFATSPIEVLSSRAPPWRIPKTREVNVAWTLPKRRAHTTCQPCYTLLTSCVAASRRTRPRLSTFRGLSDQGAASSFCETPSHNKSTVG
jgi:hypothetical protein